MVVAHVSNATGLWGGRLGAGGGQIGVMLFFVLSGYLMGAIYLDRPPGRDHVWNYGVHRLSRVIPLFYLVALTAFSLNTVSGRNGGGFPLFGLDAATTPLTLGLIRAPDVLWTVPVEVQFYAVFLVIWWLRAKSPAIAVLCLIGCLCAAMLFQPDVEKYFGWLPFHAAFFVGGVLVSLGLPRLAQGLRYWPAQIGLFIMFPLACLLAPRVYAEAFGAAGQILLIPGRETWHQPLYLFVSLGCLVAGLASRPAAWLLATRPMIYLGRVSYSLYLVHMPVVILLLQSAALSRQPTLFLLATTTLALAAASVLNVCVERPMQHRLNRWLAVPRWGGA